MSKYIHKSPNVSVLIYHFVCPAKYRKVIISKEVDESLKDICLEISKRYEISFFQDRNRQRSCTFSNTVISQIQCDRNNKNNKKYHCRLQSTLGNMSPMEYERQYSYREEVA